MPRVINGRNRNTTAKAILLKPYDRPITHALDTTTNQRQETEIKAEVKPVKKGEYNKSHLVALIVKVSFHSAKLMVGITPDWDKLSKTINKTPTRTSFFDRADSRMSRYMEENYFTCFTRGKELVEFRTWVGWGYED